MKKEQNLKNEFNYLMYYDLAYEGLPDKRKGYRRDTLGFIRNIFYTDYLIPSVRAEDVKKRNQSVYFLNKEALEKFTKLSQNFRYYIEKAIKEKINSARRKKSKNKRQYLQKLRRRLDIIKTRVNLNISFEFVEIKKIILSVNKTGLKKKV